MRVTKWGEYGILCSLNLARHFDKAAVGAPEIAESEHIPLQYTHQILQRLRKGGIIGSVRGPHGGYKLSRPPESINLREVMNAVEGDTFQVICDHNPIDPEGRCQIGTNCSLKNVWYDLKASIDALLEKKTLASMLNQLDKSEQKLVPIGTQLNGPGSS